MAQSTVVQRQGSTGRGLPVFACVFVALAVGYCAMTGQLSAGEMWLRACG